MNIIATDISDVKLIELDNYPDDRGCLMESYQKIRYDDHGMNLTFVQDNLVYSKKNVLRGLHYQLNNPQGKLVQCIYGEIFDVAVDIRKGSETYGDWVGFNLSQNNNNQLFIPPGFAHGYSVLSIESLVLYKCTNYYNPNDEYGIIWNDKDLNINWRGNSFIISEKDLNNQEFKNALKPTMKT